MDKSNPTGRSREFSEIDLIQRVVRPGDDKWSTRRFLGPVPRAVRRLAATQALMHLLAAEASA